MTKVNVLAPLTQGSWGSVSLSGKRPMRIRTGNMCQTKPLYLIVEFFQ